MAKISTNDVISKEKVTNKTKFSSRLGREIENIRWLQLETAASKVWKDAIVYKSPILTKKMFKTKNGQS